MLLREDVMSKIKANRLADEYANDSSDGTLDELLELIPRERFVDYMADSLDKNGYVVFSLNHLCKKRMLYKEQWGFPPIPVPFQRCFLNWLKDEGFLCTIYKGTYPYVNVELPDETEIS